VARFHGGNYDIFVQKFDSNGNISGLEVHLDGNNRNDYLPQITATSDGGYAVTWYGDTPNNIDIFVQKFDSSGNMVGLEVQLDGVANRPDDIPQITATSDGGYVVTWQGYNGSNTDIFVQKFDSNGNISGSKVQLDGVGVDDHSPQITATSDGGFVVTWRGYNGSNTDIFVQKFDSNGNISGSKVQLDGVGVDDHSPQITATSDGGFVVIWHGYDSNGQSDIFVQQFNSESSLISAQSSETGTAYLVNDSIAVDDVLDITGSNDDMWNSVDIIAVDTATAMSTAGLAAGTYYLYTVDAAGNLSDPSALSYTII
jgi:hypothetical protein